MLKVLSDLKYSDIKIEYIVVDPPRVAREKFDRIWEGWMTEHGRTYLPTESTADAPEGHRLKDTIISLVTTATTTPQDMLDVNNLYTYDVLPSI